MILETSGVIWSDLGKFWSDFEMKNCSVWKLGWTEYPKSHPSTQYACIYADVIWMELESIHILHITIHNRHVDYQKHDHDPVHYISEKMEGGGSFVGSGDMEFFQNGTSRDGTESGWV